MAIQKGFIKIEGTLGRVTFVKKKDKIVAREKSGVDGNLIKTDPRFERTRENMSEFAEITSASKLLRSAFVGISANAADGKLHPRLTSLMARIKNLDVTSLRGQRSVSVGLAIPGAIGLFKGLEFNIESPLGQVLKCQYQLDTSTGQLDIAGLMPSLHIARPQGATHARIYHARAQVDFGTKESHTQISTPQTIPLNATPVNLSFTLAPAVAGTFAEFYALKVEFGQELNGVYYPLNNNAFNTLGIIETL